ncbi:chitin deacetylase 8 [Venturia canescens]|uniref:chitin deacetylase 8 n=1 Tax=Venturia canescens TaxID=32260 RepID=UPI001C9C6CC9|nr:chitin deacetylase 8 [Venturia canescens]
MTLHGTTVLLGISLLLGVTNSLKLAEPCIPDKCKLPSCKCSTTESESSIPTAKIPQIIMSSFDDGVNPITYGKFNESLFGRKNPDGCPIGVTHFLSHEYTDYSKVLDLWLRGHEIALHSVTHNANIPNYWRDMNLTVFKKEFGDMRTMANNFGLIPMSEMRGVRIPFLQPSGDVSFQGLEELGLSYDSTLPTRAYVDPPMWPYTLEYATHQDCQIEPCPTASFPGVWEVPMVMWFDQQGVGCSMVDSCVNIPTDAPSITNWIIEQFNRHYKTNRAPFPIFMHAAWFLRNPENFKAYVNFVEYAQSLPDVYFVTVNKTIEWIKNPKSLDNKKPFGECTVNKAPGTCKPLGCSLPTSTGDVRWFVSCAKVCPRNYPWLGNPLGE